MPSQRVFACEPGTFALPVSDVDHTTSVLGLVLLDSGDYARSGGYGSPSAEALRFLAEVPEMMATQSQKQVVSHETAKSQEQAVPCMVFQHFPVQQYYQLLKPAATNAARAIEGYRNFAGKHYVLDEEKRFPAVIWERASAAPMPTAANLRFWSNVGISRFPRGMIIVMRSLERYRFRGIPLMREWRRLCRR